MLQSRPGKHSRNSRKPEARDSLPSQNSNLSAFLRPVSQLSVRASALLSWPFAFWRWSCVCGVTLLCIRVGLAFVGPAVEQTRCSARAWTNAFNPEQPVFPKESDVCPADEKKPLFSREGTLVCETREGLLLASNAMRHGWHYGSTAGIPDLPGSYTDSATEAEYFGCSILHDGIPEFR